MNPTVTAYTNFYSSIWTGSAVFFLLFEENEMTYVAGVFSNMERLRIAAEYVNHPAALRLTVSNGELTLSAWTI